MLIVLTGIDGSGKSTAARALVDAARGEGRNTLLLSNHAGRRRMSLISAKLGINLQPRLADAVETGIRVWNVLVSHARARNFEGLVVMDRHLHCQLALRETRGIPRGWLLPRLIDSLPEPDLIIHLDIDAEEAYLRIVARGTDEESLAHLASFRDAYRALPEYEDFVEIDADAPAAEVHQRLSRILKGVDEPVR
ncbi:AAA family ATPase [Arthrobacter sp. ISL-30]|uniref:dTMP kinase n=1 Tax=Arthrobacter sp. ISL-30 TaxID=2819109 RepID=UPI001BECED13|nr:AAA family ATPase [Arthrobacter sp. ISL-30]MBT2512594.1 AAA family ATPase [Arthrobacter sp. ISL-30]